MFSDVDPGVYAIRVSYVGYENYLKEHVTVEAGKQIDLGNLLLKASGELLEEVVVEGTPPAMELGIDRKIFNVAQSTLSVGRSEERRVGKECVSTCRSRWSP